MKMRKFGLIGYPLGHSFSQKYFTEKFLNEHISDCLYVNFPLQDLSGFPGLLSVEKELCGINITIPYKSEIIRYLDTLEPEADEIGAVNVVKIKRNGGQICLIGYNSDVTGIRDTLAPFIRDDVRNALVLGTGGSSRAVCHVLKKLGLNVNLVSRNRKPGILTYSDINSEIILRTQLIINTTPLGMFPDIDSLPDINYKLLGINHILFDLVYNPQLTSFLRRGAEQGCTTISGLKMLHFQAEKAWEIWNNEKL
jgi:shikimate dehydrogenase